MHSKRDISNLKQMTAAERKIEAMRKIKASYDRASREGSIRTREIVVAV
ncbi:MULTISPECIES: hypothetical protein [Yersinia pseudotuberculosis complex]|nr:MULTISPECIES: hypothetical protein [Yersinia pseudotuberculosis complex]MCE4113236.1 hypothetical protein [Yersinia pseudotuberculosis]WLF06153.1 hypothetical protein Q6G25_21270 [Yersinia pseudotuberculosis]